ncbi:hypothetical protein STEG23_004840 [Scotinomys teguina]
MEGADGSRTRCERAPSPKKVALGFDLHRKHTKVWRKLISLTTFLCSSLPHFVVFNLPCVSCVAAVKPKEDTIKNNGETSTKKKSMDNLKLPPQEDCRGPSRTKNHPQIFFGVLGVRSGATLVSNNVCRIRREQDERPCGCAHMQA